jgi:Protein of unknown function (DUF2933).
MNMNNEMASGVDRENCPPQTNHCDKRHHLMTGLCCLIPLLGAGVLQYLGYSSAAGFLVILMCPLMHLFPPGKKKQGQEQ